MTGPGCAARGPTLGVVVATRDRPGQLDACLASLRASIGGGGELVVVDSFSSGSATAEVAIAHDARLVRMGVPGASKARNAGWREVGAEVVAFVDDDVRVRPSWAPGMRQAFATHPEAWFVAGRIGLREEDRGAARPVALIDYDRPYAIDGSMVEDLGHGANLAVRRPALEAVGGYDERLGPGARWPAAEDLDLIDRLLLAGYCGRYEPSAPACHVQWRGRRDLVGLEWRYGVGQGARLERLRRRDGARHRALSRLVWRQWGALELASCLVQRRKLGTILVATRLAGTAVGQLGAGLDLWREARAL